MTQSLRERIQSDMVAAMKAKEKDRVQVLRMLIARLEDAAIEKRGALEPAAELQILMSYAKQRHEGVAEAEKAGRDDLVAKERFELETLRAYLPEPLSDEELDALVDEVIAAENAQSMKDMGRVMKVATARAAGRADGGRISARVKQRLSAR